MGVKAMSWAFEAPIFNPSAKFVLVALAEHASDHAGEDWTCFPSMGRLAHFTGQSEKTVQRALNWLEGQGWISRARRRLPGGKLGIYDFVLHRDREADFAADSGAETGADQRSDCPVDQRSNQPPTSGQIGLSPAVKLTAQDEPSLEPSEEPPLRARPDGQAKGWREAAIRLGDEVWRLWPADDRKTSSEQLVIGAVETALGRGADPAMLMIGCRAAVADKGARGASGRLISPHAFIAEGRWKTFTDLPPGAPGGPFDARHALFADLGVRRAFAARFGEGAAVSWLDPCLWDEGGRRIHPRNGTADRWLREHRAVEAMSEQGVTLGVVIKVLDRGAGA